MNAIYLDLDDVGKLYDKLEKTIIIDENYLDAPEKEKRKMLADLGKGKRMRGL